MPNALIALGSNLGQRRQLLEAAVHRLAATPGVHSVKVASWRETKPIGGPPGQPPYLNGAALVETSLSPEVLLAALELVELDLGRSRRRRWEARPIDLDLLLFDKVVLHTPKLTLPHPRMAFRRFVLEPAAEIAPAMVHPTIGWTMAQLLQHLHTALPYVAISGAALPLAQREAASRLATAVADKTGWQVLQFAAIPPFDSPSLTLTTAIEFLRRLAEALARPHWPPALAGAISPFWIEDLLALGDELWPGAMDSAWQALLPTVVPPKLLVVPPQPIASSDNQSLHHRLAVALRLRAIRPGLGPVLWLEGTDTDAAEAELRSAIESMS